MSRFSLLCLLFVAVGSAPATAATYFVNRTDDDPTATACTGPSNNDCSLRGAILAANANPGPDTIYLGEHIYTLTVAGDETDGAAGDLDVTGDVTIQGVAKTVVQACAPQAPATDCVGIDRVFHVHPVDAAVHANLKIFTIRFGTTKGEGGGLLVDAGATVTLDQVVVEQNAADGSGGGIANHGTLTFTNGVIAANTCSDSGGGAFTDGPSFSIVQTTVRDNVAFGGGGGLARTKGVLSISACTISGNVAGDGNPEFLAGSGGGVFIGLDRDTTSSIADSTISGNSGHVAGGVAGVGPVVMAGCTVTANAVHNGRMFGSGGIASLGTMSFRNSIVAGNTADVDGDPDCAGAFTSLGYNLVGIGDLCGGVTAGTNGDQAGTAAAPLDPMLGPLADNGGPTRTHALIAGSPAIDAGNPASPNGQGNACSTFDQRHTTRGTPQTGRCDVGAYELFGSGTTTTTSTSTSTSSSTVTTTTETTTTLESTTTVPTTTSTIGSTITTTSSSVVSTLTITTTTTSSMVTTTSSTLETTSTTESTTSTLETTTTTETSTSTSTSSSSSSTSSSTSTSTTSTTRPPEICGNCIDDDGNGLTDFEDPACCTQLQLSAMTVHSAGITTGKSGTSLKLAASLLQSPLSTGTTADQDVYLQIRQPGHAEVLCAHLPAASLTRKKSTIQFHDKRHTVGSAAGVDSLVLKGKKNGTGVLTIGGSKLAVTLPPAGDLQITVALRNPSTAETGNRCTGAQVTFKASKKGGLKYP